MKEKISELIRFLLGSRKQCQAIEPGGLYSGLREAVMEVLTELRADEWEIDVVDWLAEIVGSENETPRTVERAMKMLIKAAKAQNLNVTLLADEIVEEIERAERNHPMHFVLERAAKLKSLLK